MQQALVCVITSRCAVAPGAAADMHGDALVALHRRLAFVTCSGLCLLTTLASLALHLRTRRLYHAAMRAVHACPP